MVHFVSNDASHTSDIYQSPFKNQGENTDGFSLLEAMVSLLVLFAVMAGLLPVFMSWRLTTINNKIKTGAIAISQQILDELRQDPNVDAWALSGKEVKKPSGELLDAIEYGGRTYNASITYCNESDYCDTNTRQITLEINHNESTIYTIETIYTKFE